MNIRRTMHYGVFFVIVCGFPFSVSPLIGSQGDDMSATRGCQVTVLHDSTRSLVRVDGGTVEQALNALGIAIDGDDIVTPSPGTPVAKDITVQVVRVSTKVVAQEVCIPAPRTVVVSSRLRRGRAQAVQAGCDGKVVRKYEIEYHDGKEWKRKLLSEAVVTPARPHVIAMSAGTLASRHGRVRRTLIMHATAYTAGCGGAGSWTAIGMRAAQGVVAVDPRVIPLGSRLYIEEYGFAIAGDTGGAIKGDRIDLGVDTLREARIFGRRTVTVHILE